MPKRKSSKSRKTPPQAKKTSSRWHAAPLKGSFMITAILGVLISAFWVYPQSFNYGITFILVFTIMFIASLVSMTKGPATEK